MNVCILFSMDLLLLQYLPFYPLDISIITAVAAIMYDIPFVEILHRRTKLHKVLSICLREWRASINAVGRPRRMHRLGDRVVPTLFSVLLLPVNAVSPPTDTLVSTKACSIKDPESPFFLLSCDASSSSEHSAHAGRFPYRQARLIFSDAYSTIVFLQQ